MPKAPKFPRTPCQTLTGFSRYCTGFAQSQQAAYTIFEINPKGLLDHIPPNIKRPVIHFSCFPSHLSFSTIPLACPKLILDFGEGRGSTLSCARHRVGSGDCSLVSGWPGLEVGGGGTELFTAFSFPFHRILLLAKAKRPHKVFSHWLLSRGKWIRTRHLLRLFKIEPKSRAICDYIWLSATPAKWESDFIVPKYTPRRHKVDFNLSGSSLHYLGRKKNAWLSRLKKKTGWQGLTYSQKCVLLQDFSAFLNYKGLWQFIKTMHLRAVNSYYEIKQHCSKWLPFPILH